MTDEPAAQDRRRRPFDRWLMRAWYAVGAVAVVGIVTESSAVVGVSGLLAAAFGATLASDFRGFATRESGRGWGIGPVQAQYSPGYFRMLGVGFVVVGIGWAIAGFSGSFA